MNNVMTSEQIWSAMALASCQDMEAYDAKLAELHGLTEYFLGPVSNEDLMSSLLIAFVDISTIQSLIDSITGHD